jgi:hypothetical protein
MSEPVTSEDFAAAKAELDMRIQATINWRREQGLDLVPKFIVQEVMKEIAPDRASAPLMYEACSLHVAYLVRVALGIPEEPGSVYAEPEATPKSEEQLRTAAKVLKDHASALENEKWSAQRPKD